MSYDPSATSGPQSFSDPAPANPDAGFDPSATSGPQSFHPSQSMPGWQDPSLYKKNLPNPYTRPDLNKRVYSMIQSGAQWLPLQTLYSFADSGLGDDELLQLTEHLRRLSIDGVKGSMLKSGVPGAKQGLKYQQQANKAVAPYAGVLDTSPGVTAAVHGTAAVSTADEFIKKADDGFKHFLDDPVLQKHPSAALVARSYLANVLGPAPVAGDTLKHTQKQLQLMGFGRDLPVDGTMSPGWSGAFASWKNNVFQSQLSGNRPGSISVDHALKALSAITPGEAWPAIYNWITAIPHAGRQLLADLAGGVAGTIHMVTQEPRIPFFSEAPKGENEAFGQTSSDVTNALLGNTTPKKQTDLIKNDPGRLILEDGINIVMMSSMLSAVSRFSEAAGLEKLASTNPEIGANLSKEAAFRGPGAIARSLSSEVPGTTVWEHLPILRNIGPVVNNLADGEGMYYSLRNFTHQPWTWVNGQEGVTAAQGAIGTGLRLGDVAFQKSLLLGAEARGLGQVEQTLTGDENAPFAKNINKSTPIDEMNDALKTFNIAGTHPLSLDDLMFVFGGAGAHALNQTTSQELGRTAAGLQKSMTNALHDVGASEGVSRLYEGKSIPYISKQFGGTDNFSTFIWGKIYDESARFAAQNEYDRSLASDGLPIQLSSGERVEKIRNMAADIRKDPAKLQDAFKSLMSQGGGNELYARLHNDKILHPQSWDPAVVVPRIEASNHVRDNILPWIDTTVPDGSKVFPQGGDASTVGIVAKDTKTVQDAHVFNQTMEDELKSIRAREAYNPDETLYAQRQTSVGEEHLNPATPSPGPKPTPQEVLDWNQKMDNHLQDIYGINGTMMPQKWEDKVKISKELTERHLPVELVAHSDAPPALHAAMQALDDQGYKLVDIKDYGHKIQDVGPLEQLKGGLTFRRKLVENIGLNPDNIFDATIGQEAQNNILTEVKKVMDNKGVKLGPGQTPASIIQVLRSHGVLPEGDILKGKIADLMGSKTRLQKLLGSDAEALQTQLPLRDASRKSIVKALMDPEIMASRDPASYDMWNAMLTANNATEIPPWMTERDANLIAHAIVKGYAKVPTAFTGLNHVEDMFRGIGFMGLGMDNKLGYAMANLPNKLIQIRNQIRFDLSPMFDFRRVFKTNVKMAAMDIPPSWDPVKALVDSGTWEEARTALTQARPAQFRAEILGYADDADRYLASQGVFHYNQLGYETWAAYHMKQAGMTPEQIDTNLTKLFQYGNRSGMERSTNFLFFPFSFEKALYKVMGTYILDRPAQRLLLTHAVAAYDQFNREHMDGSNPLATSFWQKHAPLFEEASRLNAFTMGISPGESGGINRPLLNLFLPQSWSPTEKSVKGLLPVFLPVLKDFQRIFNESIEQTHIARDWASNLYNDAMGNKATIGNPRKSTLTASEDLSAGFQMYLDLKKAYQKNIENGDKIPIDPQWGKFAGKTVTNQVLRQMVAIAHPAYTAEGAATYVITNNQTFDDYETSLKGTPQADGKFHGAAKLDDGSPAYPYVHRFREATNQLGYDLLHTDNPAALAGRTQALRDVAQYLAENDSQFFKLYPKTFGRILGPLEAVK